MRSLLKQVGFPYSTKTISRGEEDRNGGVFIASRWPITFEDKYIFTTKVPKTLEARIPMGIAYAAISKVVNDQTSLYHVFGTQMKSSAGEANEEARELQAQELKAFVESKRIPNVQAVILAGDFNGDFLQTNEHALRMLNNMDAVLPKPAGKVFYTYDPLKNMFANRKQPRQWLDYVVTMKGYGSPKTATLEAVELKSKTQFRYCSCEDGCEFVSFDYMYPGTRLCDEDRETTQQYSHHFPVKAVFEF